MCLNLKFFVFTFSADDDDDEIVLNVESHYAQAKVGNFVLNIGDCVFVKVNFISFTMSCLGVFLCSKVMLCSLKIIIFGSILTYWNSKQYVIAITHLVMV